VATYSPDGGVTNISAFQGRQTVFRAVSYHDIGLRRPEYFAGLKGRPALMNQARPPVASAPEPAARGARVPAATLGAAGSPAIAHRVGRGLH
jgi:hypothetical protein